MTSPTAMAAPHISLADEKRAARTAARAARAACDPAWGHDLADLVLNAALIPPNAIVAGFWPLPGEIDIRPLMQALATRGCTICLPDTPPAGAPLIFRIWNETTQMRPGRFGTLVPDAPSITPTLVLVPLLGFDRTGARLGYGGGYYDRTLARLPGRPTIGCAFAAQEVERVPTEATDIRLSAVATERAIHRFAV